MKNIVMMLVSGVMGVLTLAIVMTIFGRVNRSAELQSSLSTAMEMTLERRMGDAAAGGGTVVDPAGVEPSGETGAGGIRADASPLAVAECVEYLAAAVDSDTGITVKVYMADMEKGVLSMKAVAEYEHPDGTDGSTEWERTVIYNRSEEEEPGYYEVCFYRSKADMLGEGLCYKSMVVREGDHIHPPTQPAGAGAGFAGWRDINDYIADFSGPVEQKLTYYADWE